MNFSDSSESSDSFESDDFEISDSSEGSVQRGLAKLDKHLAGNSFMQGRKMSEDDVELKNITAKKDQMLADQREITEAAISLEATLRQRKEETTLRQRKEGSNENRLESKEIENDRIDAAIRIQSLGRGRQVRRQTAELYQQKVKTKASIKLQSFTRGCQGRNVANARNCKVLEEKNTAALQIQAIRRGYVGRIEVAEKRKLQHERNNAAIKLQSLTRGHHDRNLSEQMLLYQKKSQNNAATQIQAVHRGNQGRKETFDLAISQRERERERKVAVIKLQSTTRGHQRRKKKDIQKLKHQYKQTQSATKIQAMNRGRIARGKANEKRRVRDTEKKLAKYISKVKMLEIKLKTEKESKKVLQQQVKSAENRANIHASQVAILRKETVFLRGKLLRVSDNNPKLKQNNQKSIKSYKQNKRFEMENNEKSRKLKHSHQSNQRPTTKRKKEKNKYFPQVYKKKTNVRQSVRFQN